MTTEIIPTIAGIRRSVAAARRAGQSIACVPTMGALHAGHGSLIDRARAEAGFVVVTIFVNPIQFDRPDDYEKYARNLAADRAFCATRNVDAIFAPSAAEMYPEPSATFVELPEMARHLCGEFRPGHFRGVATVVAKLFNIVQPDTAFFGQKDAQQLAIIRRMVRDLNFPIDIVAVPTIREPDGLALSSRNQRLSPEERSIAPEFYRALAAGRAQFTAGVHDTTAIKRAVLETLEPHPQIRIEYIEVVDHLMQPVEKASPADLLAAAIWLGNTRLIDNVPLSVTTLSDP